MKKTIIHLGLMLNTFAIFGIFFFLIAFWGMEFFDTSQYEYQNWFLMLVSVVLNYVIYFFAFLYLKLISNNYAELEPIFIRHIIVVCLFFYYLSFFFRASMINSYGLRTLIGFSTPLWMLSPLIVLKALDRKLLYTVLGLMFVESLWFLGCYYYAVDQKTNLAVIWLTGCIAIVFPFFEFLLNKINFKFQLYPWLRVILLSCLFVLGLFFAFFYFLLV